MERYYIDERVGCIAICDAAIHNDSNGLNPSKRNVVRYWSGIDITGRIFGARFVTWRVPGYIRKRARRICQEMNAE